MKNHVTYIDQFKSLKIFAPPLLLLLNINNSRPYKTSCSRFEIIHIQQHKILQKACSIKPVTEKIYKTTLGITKNMIFYEGKFMYITTNKYNEQVQTIDAMKKACCMCWTSY